MANNRTWFWADCDFLLSFLEFFFLRKLFDWTKSTRYKVDDRIKFTMPPARRRVEFFYHFYAAIRCILSITRHVFFFPVNTYNHYTNALRIKKKKQKKYNSRQRYNVGHIYFANVILCKLLAPRRVYDKYNKCTRIVFIFTLIGLHSFNKVTFFFIFPFFFVVFFSFEYDNIR